MKPLKKKRVSSRMIDLSFIRDSNRPTVAKVRGFSMSKIIKPLLSFASLLFFLFLLSSQTAFAAVESSGVLNEVGERFLSESTKWGAIITKYASWLFWTLVTISMVWTFGFMALRKADIQEFFAELLKFIISVGFFWWLLINGPDIGMSIVNSLRKIGAEASGLTSLNPSTPIDIAFDIVAKAAKSYSMTSPIDNLSIFLISLAILACMAIVAANVLLALVTAYTLAYGGVFVLGFGGARWTTDIALNYFKSVLGIALKLMTMTLLVGIAVSIMDGFHASLAEKASMEELMIVFVVALVLVILINTIPNVVAGLVPGGGGAASAGSSFGAGAIIGAGATAVGMATSGAAMAGQALTQTGGAVSAIQAAMQAAGGGGGDLDTGIGSISGGSSGSDSDPVAAGDTPFAQAAGFGSDGSSGSDGGTGSSGADGGGGSAGSAGSDGSTDTSSGSDSLDSQIQGDANRVETAADSGGDVIGAADKGSRDGGGSGSGNYMSASDTPFAQAGGFAGAVKLAAGTAGELAKAAGSAAKSDFQQRVSETAGGKMAARIKANSEGNNE